MKPHSALSPADVLAQVAHALPAEIRAEVIIIGSLAAGYHFFAEDGSRAIRTKDVDCLLTPHSEAIAAAAKVTNSSAPSGELDLARGPSVESAWPGRRCRKRAADGSPSAAKRDRKGMVSGAPICSACI